MNRASLSFRATRRTRPSPLGAPCPALGPGRVALAAFPLAGRLPSTASAAPPWALFGGFAGTTRPSDFSRSSITGLRPWPSPHDPPDHQHRRVTVSPPGSRHEEIARMLGFFDPAGSTDGSRKRRQRCCLPSSATASAPQPTTHFRGSIAGLRTPLPTLRCALAGRQRIARGHRGSLLLRCRALSSPTPCRFIPALSSRRPSPGRSGRFSPVPLRRWTRGARGTPSQACPGTS